MSDEIARRADARARWIGAEDFLEWEREIFYWQRNNR